MNSSSTGQPGAPGPGGGSGPYGPQAYPPQNLPPGAPGPTGQPPTRPGRFPWGIVALVLGILAFLGGIVPLVGALGVLPIIFGLVELLGGDAHAQRRQPRVMATVGIVLGVLGCGAAAIWVVIIATSSCPHVYAFNGERFELDADPLSGSFLEAAESTDWDRLEHLAPVDGEYRLRVTNERRERDFVNSLKLLVVDHSSTSVVLPTQTGELVELSGLAEPIAVTDSRDRDVLALAHKADDQRWVTRLEDVSEDAEGGPRDWIVAEFPRPAFRDTVLLFRGRGTDFAAESLARYLASMGPGLGTLLEWSQCSESYPFRDRVRDEIHRLGLVVDIELWDGSEWVHQTEIKPIGPAVVRDQAVRLRLPEGDSDSVRVRFAMTPLFCEIDRLALALDPVRVAEPNRLDPSRALGTGGTDTQATLTAHDGSRVQLDEGQSTDVVFLAPPAPAADQTRTVVLEISGYYSFDIGGRNWINPLAIWRHRSGADSLPRFAVRLARERAEP